MDGLVGLDWIWLVGWVGGWTGMDGWAGGQAWMGGWTDGWMNK